jgi:hypothetical protein
VLVLGIGAFWDGISHFAPSVPPLSRASELTLLASGLALLAAAMAVAIATKKQPLTSRQRRTAVGWAALLVLQLGNLLNGLAPWVGLVAGSASCLLGAEWARRGLRSSPPATPGWRRWYRLLLASLVILAVTPWVALGAAWLA